LSSWGSIRLGKWGHCRDVGAIKLILFTLNSDVFSKGGRGGTGKGVFQEEKRNHVLNEKKRPRGLSRQEKSLTNEELGGGGQKEGVVLCFTEKGCGKGQSQIRGSY